MLAAWQRSKALEAEAERLNERSREIEEKIPRIVDVDERLARARDRP